MHSDFFAPGNLKVAFITGHHPYNVPSLHTMFRCMEGVDFYPQSLDEYAYDDGKNRSLYDVLVFYNYHMETPETNPEVWWQKGIRQALDELGETGQGILLLHHAITAFPEWELWTNLTGLQDRRFTYHPNQMVHTEIAYPEHPIVRGLTSWKMEDEVYTMGDTGEDSQVLLRIDHPQSMRTVGWTRVYKKSRVFCYQSGHNQAAFTNPHFREIVRRGLLWVSHRLPE